MQDQEIIELLLQKNEKGIEILLKHYEPLIKYVIAPILPNPQDQEECLSEVTLRVWKGIDQFDSCRGSWNAWLTAIARNTALNHARHNSHHKHTENVTENMLSEKPTPEEIILQKERQEALSRAIQRLTPNEKILFYRKYYYLQSTAQIASELCTTERSIEGKLYRLRKKLREMLGGDFYA